MSRKFIYFLFIILASFCIKATADTTRFPIASTATGEFCAGGAFDGTNFLVSILGGTGGQNQVTAQIVSQDGTLVGGRLFPGGTTENILIPVAFDGTSYLVTWQEMSSSGDIYGKFIEKNGNPGEGFFICSNVDEIGHIGFGGGTYLLVYTRSSKVYGRTISPGGVVGDEISVSSGFGKDRGGFGNLPFDGTNFLVVWTEDTNDYEVRGRFVSAAGIPGTEFSVNASLSPSDDPCATAFDGTNFLVVWPDEVGGHGSQQWAFFAQLISKAGEKVGSVISVTNTSSAAELIAPAAVFDGTRYLLTWSKLQNADTEWKIYGRLLNTQGFPLDSEFIIENSLGNQLGGAVGYANGQYLIIINDNISVSIQDEEFQFTPGDVFGIFKTFTPRIDGDLNKDGEVNISDVILTLRKSIGLDP